MEQSQQRAATVLAIRERMQTHGVKVTEQEAVQVALAAGTRCAEDLLGFLFNKLLARKAAALGGTGAITNDEFGQLFGSRARPTCDGGLSSVVDSAEFATFDKRLRSSLRCSLIEKEPSAVWVRAHGRAASYYSLHALDVERSIKLSLGGLVHADVRRLEELSNDIDSDGPEVMLLSKCIIALARSVV